MNLCQKTLAIAVISLVSSSAFAFGPGNTPVGIRPSGWTWSDTANSNVWIAKRDNENTYMQVIDVKGGARIDFFHPGKQYGSWGNYPKFSLYTIDQLWSMTSGQVSMVNGQFFEDKVNATALSYDVVSDWSILTYGQSAANLPRKQLEIYDNVGVKVLPWDRSRYSNARNVMVGLDPSVDASASAPIGRFYVCTKVNPSAFSYTSQWLLMLSARNITQNTAMSYMSNWGCDPGSIMLMDGSSSAQLKTSGGIRMYGLGSLTNTNRPVPQAIKVSNRGMFIV